MVDTVCIRNVCVSHNIFSKLRYKNKKQHSCTVHSSHFDHLYFRQSAKLNWCKNMLRWNRYYGIVKHWIMYCVNAIVHLLNTLSVIYPALNNIGICIFKPNSVSFPLSAKVINVKSEKMAWKGHIPMRLQN